MKIIVCGAGSVGKSIVDYLNKGNNDIIVIDNNSQNLDDISKEFDILPILGSASSPSALLAAGAKTADLLIAVTDDDEVNILSCEFAHKIFNIPQKIARIDKEDYLTKDIKNMFEGEDSYINLIISPNEAIAEHVYRILKISGCEEAYPVLGAKMYVLALKITDKCPFLDIPLLEIERIDESLDANFICLVRDKQDIVITPQENFKKDDVVYVLTPKDKIFDTLHSFGSELPINEKVIIFGGDKISKYLGNLIEKDDNILNASIIEESKKKALELSQSFNDISVICGSMMSDTILEDINVNQSDISVALTQNDKDNLLVSLLVQKNGVNNTVSLVNTGDYDSLLDNIGNSILVDRSAVTISKLLKKVRKVPLDIAYSLGRGFGEIWQVNIAEDYPKIGKKIQEFIIPKNSKICAIMRNKVIIYPSLEDEIKADDKIILYVSSTAIRMVEKIF